MAVPVSVSVKVGGIPLSPDYLRTLQSVEVEMAVYKQAIFRMRFAIGQDPGGNWAEGAEQLFTPLQSVQIDAQINGKTQRLINGLLTEFKMSFKAEPCESQLELVGADALEKVKRATRGPAGSCSQSARGSHAGQSLRAIVSKIFSGQGITPPPSGVPDTGSPNPTRHTLNQTQNDLELLRKLADENGCDIYVEPTPSGDQGRFEPLELTKAPAISTRLQANQGVQSPVRNASFFYDLSGPTAVEANFVGANGKSSACVRVDLRDLVTGKDKALLGPPGFAHVVRLERHGIETRDQLQHRCKAELEKHSWVVIGRGELDTAAYGDFLIARHLVKLQGVSSSFSGDFLVWQVTHSFARDLYCQRFEVRKKLGVR